MKNEIEFSDFYCTKCGKKGLTLPRVRNRARTPGHLKNLYCPYCKEEHNAAEVKQRGKYTRDVFFIEWENGNFDEQGNRKKPYEQFLREVSHV